MPSSAPNAPLTASTPVTAAEPVDTGAVPPFTDLPTLLARNAAQRPDATAVVVNGQALSWADFDARASRVAAALQQQGLAPRDTVAVCASSSIDYLAVFMGALRAGVAVAPLAPSSTPEQLAGMAADADARVFFVDAAVAAALDGAGLAPQPGGLRPPLHPPLHAPLRVRLDNSAGTGADIGQDAWLAAAP
ncbi:MAG: hypothetical protein CFE45_06345, partial [Burkholderiales bacterium PBB5]